MRCLPALTVALTVLLGACTAIGQYEYAATNVPLAAPPAETPRATFQVDGRERGNPRVLMYLALSGGGSRAAYLSTSTMHALARPELGLLGEVDAIAAVSGGSLAAAYYTASRDAEIGDPAFAARLRALAPPPAGLVFAAGDRLRCSPALPAAERTRLAALLDAREVQRLVELCRAGDYPPWEEKASLETMKKNFLFRWVGHLLLPQNLSRYWFTSFDRSDIMANTLASAALARPGLSNLLADDLTLGDLNPLRPNLMISATNATQQFTDDGAEGTYPFGSMFTFTHDDFEERLNADIRPYALARAVMASSAYPLAFATMSLEDFHVEPKAPNPERRFLHLIDGGNSDNLGLRAVKRSLLELQARGELARYDRIVVLLVDAFATPKGTGPHKPDPRSVIDLLLDTNVTHAVDSLLQANRDRLLDDFDRGELHFGRECAFVKNSIRHFPGPLCSRLKPGGKTSDEPNDYVVGLQDKLVFFHFGFADVVRFAGDREGRELKRQLDLIPTSFSISDERVQPVESFYRDGYETPRSKESETDLIDKAVAFVIRPDHPCIGPLAALLRQPEAAPGDVQRVRSTCNRIDLRQ